MHLDLLEQAEQLAALDPKRPRQANLRRAISAAYYAVFHALVDEACASQLGAQHDQARFRHVLGRAYTHATMKNACASFRGGTLKASVQKGLPTGFTIPAEIQEVAQNFVELQESRHLADYDLTERFRRSEVQALIRNTRQRLEAFTQLPSSNEKKFFLACLWAWKELTNR